MLTIYGRNNCNYCTKAKDLAEQYSLNYTYKSLEDWENVEEMLSKVILKLLHKFGGTVNILVVIKSLRQKYKIQLAITDRGLSSHG
jgi:arsenate reductase-like glutaredoxin family protein